MKNRFFTVFCALTLAAMPVMANPFPDATGDFTGGVDSLDITSVSVANDATMLTFTITLNGNPTEADWYNYFVGIAAPSLPGGGNLNAAGGWGRNIQMSAGGMDYFIGSYPFWGGFDLLTWNGASWGSVGGVPSSDATSVTISVALASLGLSVGDTISFDVWASTSGTDTVLDALSDTVSRTWGPTPFDTGSNALSYTVIPEPTTLTLLAAGFGLLMLQRRRARQ